MFHALRIAVVACAVLALPSAAWAQPADEPAAACAAPPPIPKKTAKDIRDAAAYIMMAGALGAAVDEAAGEQPAEAPQAEGPPEEEPVPPAPECLLETLDTDGVTIRAFYTPGETAGDRQYRFAIGTAGEERIISVLPEPLIAILVKEGDYAAVMETRGDSTLIYRILRNEPSYDMLKAMVLDILRGAVRPVIGLQRKDDGSTNINVYDMDRMSR